MNPIVYNKHSPISALHNFPVHFFCFTENNEIIIIFTIIILENNYSKMFLMKTASFNNVLNTTTVETWKHTPLETTKFQIPKLI